MRNSTKSVERLSFSKVRKKIWRDRYFYIMCLPVFIYFLIFKYWPMAWLSIAFKDFKILKGFSGSEWVGFENFEKFFQQSGFLVFDFQYSDPEHLQFGVLLHGTHYFFHSSE